MCHTLIVMGVVIWNLDRSLMTLFRFLCLHVEFLMEICYKCGNSISKVLIIVCYERGRPDENFQEEAGQI